MAANPLHRPKVKQCILVVEDSKTQRQILRLGLSATYTLLWATNARDAMALAFTKRPDLIILDVNIEPPPCTEDPVGGHTIPSKYISGLEVCRHLKKSVLKKTPVLVLTAQSGFIPRIRGHLAHANEYLTKPVETDDLICHIHKYLGIPDIPLPTARVAQLASGLDDPLDEMR